MKVSTTINAFITSDWGMCDFLDALEASDSAAAVKCVNYGGDHMIGYEGWVHVGTAQITVDLLATVDIQGEYLNTLKAKLQAVRAENQQRENAILDAISKLTAIEYTEAK